uniref:Retrovirus-related Pol polyprotein from transposon 17.6 n=1 Tax=Cajanus cajan TaxID=3821 RepID=A0A151SCF6_CAJCA|nr:Retrovirus-related Pol polyprotein from transposon 17.6 [Cajanus cajan]
MREGNHRQADHGGRARGEWTRNNDEEKFTLLNVPRRQILHDVNNASLFEFPAATERQLGPFKTDWCEFHRTHAHSTENFFVLGRQIKRLIKEGRLKHNPSTAISIPSQGASPVGELPLLPERRLMDKVLVNQLGRNVEAYVDDMVVKSMSLDRHLDDLRELFETIGKYQLKLNPEKCSFGVQAGKFLGFLLTHRGIEANPEKCTAIINMRSPSTAKEVQQLTGRMASLSQPRYQKIEKLALAILVTARKLRHYFQSYEVIVRMDHPIRQVLQKPDLAGRMMKWSIELLEYSIKYEPRGAIKAQALANFVMDGAGIVLEGPGGILLEQSLRFEFRASNNQAEYKALLAGMVLAKEMGATSLSARSDSQLITGQVAGTFQAKDPQLAKYLEKVKLLSDNFREFTLNHVPREQNSRADLLSKLASTKKPGDGVELKKIDELILLEEAFNGGEALNGVTYLENNIQTLTKTNKLPHKYKGKNNLYKRLFENYTIYTSRTRHSLHDRAFQVKITLGLTSPLVFTRSNSSCILLAIALVTRPLVHGLSVQKCDGCQRHATLHHSPEKVRAFLWKNVVCRYGVPQVLVSDNGTQFASARVRDFCRQIGIRTTFTSVEHPQSNGQAESANKVILSGLKKRVQDSGASWVEELPRVLWSYHTTVHSSTQDTPFNLVYGTDAMIPIEIAEPSVRTTAFSEEESD